MICMKFLWLCKYRKIFPEKKIKKSAIWWFHGDFSKFQGYNFQALSTHYETSFTMVSTLTMKVITIEALHNLWCILHLSKLTKPKFSYFPLTCLMTMTLLIIKSHKQKVGVVEAILLHPQSWQSQNIWGPFNIFHHNDFIDCPSPWKKHKHKNGAQRR